MNSRSTSTIPDDARNQSIERSLEAIRNLPLFPDCPAHFSIYADNLKEPEAVAVDPNTHAVYITEPRAHRIRKLRIGQSTEVIDKDFGIMDELPLNAPCGDTSWRAPRLRHPAHLACDSQGRLYVAEARRGGRILRFAVDGHAVATVIALASADRSRAFSSLKLDENERLIATSYLVDGTHREPRVHAFEPDASGRWRETTDAPDLLTQAPNGRTVRRTLAFSPEASPVAIDELDDDGPWLAEAAAALKWLARLGKVGGVTVDRKTDSIYFTLKKSGAVIRVIRSIPSVFALLTW